MRTSFPVEFVAVFCGKSGNSGQFKDPETGELVDFSEAYAFDFDSADGTVQRLSLRASKIDDVAEGVDVGKLERYSHRVKFVGDVVLNTEGRSYFKPISVTPAGSTSSPKPTS